MPVKAGVKKSIPLVTVELPCKPVVMQYLINHYGPALHLPDNDWIKLLIHNLLHRGHATRDKEITIQYYTKKAKVPITYKAYELFGAQLTKTAIREINNRIEDIIHQQLFQFLEFYVHVANYDLKAAIIMFQAIYAFPDEIYPAETINKYYQRRIQPYINFQKFTSLNVPLKKKLVYKKKIKLEPAPTHTISVAV